MLISESPGTHETFHPSGWLYELKFLEFVDNFIYHVKPVQGQVLLFLDSHDSNNTSNLKSVKRMVLYC
jgi:hypothetical protein